MSDLFFRIAERALGLAPTIQPMVTPFFAPTQQQESTDLFFEALPDEAQSDEGWQARATTGQNSRDPEQPREPERPQSQDKARMTSPMTRQPEYPQVPEYTPVSEYSSLPQHIHTPERPSYPEHAPVPVYREQPQPAPMLAHPLLPQHSQHEYTPEHPHTMYPHPPSPGYPQRVPLQYAPRPAFADPVDEGRARIGEVVRAEAALPPAVQPLTGTLVRATTPEMGSRRASTPNTDSLKTGTRTQTTPRQAERYTSETEPESRQTAPTVHVTIGRIEVRATPAPATSTQAQRQQATPKTMSLDEYLKQSGKGGGR